MNLSARPDPHAPDDYREEVGEPGALEQAFPWLSTASLVVANLIPLAGVLFWGWDMFAVMFLFWAENVVIGGFNILRMAMCQPDEPVMWGLKLFMIPFFAVHYGGFCLGHGIFVVALFGKSQQVPMDDFGPQLLLRFF
jgi:hypothetical protein